MLKKLLFTLMALLPCVALFGQVKPPKDAPQITFKVNPNEELLVEFQTDETETLVWVETEAGYAAPAKIHSDETKSVQVPTRGDFVRIIGKVSMLQVNLQNDALVSLDASNNSYIRKMSVLGSGLQKVNVDNCSNLSVLFLDNNFLLNIDVSKCPNLEELSAKDCQLENVNLGSLKKLRKINLVNNHLESLDVTKCAALETLLLIHNDLTTLDISQNVLLDKLELQENEINALDVSKNEKLSELWLLRNNLTELNLKNNPLLLILTVGENALSKLDLSNQYLLQTLICSEQKVAMEELDLTACTELEKLWATDNQTKRLILGKKSKLLTMDISSNELENIDLSECPSLVEAFISNNKLKKITVNGLGELRKLRLSKNQLTTLNLDNLMLLSRLELQQNKLSELQLSNTEMMNYLDLRDNNFNVAALNSLTNGLNERNQPGVRKKLFVKGNPGSERYNSQIPINKNWQVDVEGKPYTTKDVEEEFEPYFNLAGKYFSISIEGKDALQNEYEELKKNVSDEAIQVFREKVMSYIKWPQTGYYRIKNINPEYPITEHYIGVPLKRRLQGLNEEDVKGAAAVFYCEVDADGYIHFSVQGQSVEECYKKGGKVMWLRSTAAPYEMRVVAPGKVQFISVDNDSEYRALNLAYVKEKDDYPLVGGTPEGYKSWWEMEDAEIVDIKMSTIGEHTFKTYYVDFPMKPKTGGLMAYRVVWKNVDDRESLDIIPIDGVIPASTPVLLIANEEEVELEVAPKGECAVIPQDGNHLNGNYWKGYNASPWNMYIKACDGGVGFVQEGSIPYEANCAYLPVGKNVNDFEYIPIHLDQIITHIDGLKTNSVGKQGIYTISGKRAKKIKSGVFIVNGMKVIYK